MKKIVIAGGTGFLGQVLCTYFLKKGYCITVFTRNHKIDKSGIKYIKWDGKNYGKWNNELEGAEALINLSGKSVNCRYTPENKQEIYDSRINSTYILGEAIQLLKQPPKVWINSSSATIYRHSETTDMDEQNGELGEGFSVDVCKKWEATFFSADTFKTRKVALRTAIVLGKKGAFEPLKNLVKFGLGGKQGDGQQYFSWIHELDFARAVEHIMLNNEIEGALNLSAPYPLKNKQFMGSLRKAMKVPLGINAPKLLLQIGAFLIGTETELILKSRRVVPLELFKSGFEFRFENIDLAFKDILNPNVEF